MSTEHFHPAELSLDCCIKCNICTSACPVTAVSDLFPGPKYVGPQAARFRAPGQPSPDHSVDYCSGCRVCNMVCPSGVKIAEMNARARAVMVQQGRVPLRLRLRNNLLARSELLGRLGQPVAPLANLLLHNPLSRWLAEHTLGIARAAPLPFFARERFTTWFRRHPQPEGATRRVVYFHGCSTEYYEPRVGRAAVYVLEHNGCEVIVPPQNCCGLPLLSNGEFSAARAYHTRNVRHLVTYARQGIPIVGTSTSCILTLKEEAPELLDMWDEDTQLVAANTYDLHEFLLTLWETGVLRTDFKPLPWRLVYHPPCQYRAHRLGRPAAEMMRLIPGLEIIESHAACCGIGGTYGYKLEKYTIAMEVGRPLFDFIAQVGGPLVVCDSETCRWQITHGTGKPAVHPVELLALAYGYPAEGALAALAEAQRVQVSQAARL
ncbi:MAG: anaerobic glycerol-3-phosphate dehydrogenase subunit C [Anaerolineae bacterium]|nr:anaerobic glycerol-3-phosphate dehydrogenase subunit C [Anaerolineae bacterium]MDW8070965.1 anaerobic glycerol-3-phosphate dehydrogenase subunit C [Anaerolineae bacterium]